MFVRLAFEVPVAMFCGLVFAVIFEPLFVDLVRPGWTGSIGGPFMILGILGSLACLIIGRGQWSLYFALILAWLVFLFLCLEPVLNAQY